MTCTIIEFPDETSASAPTNPGKGRRRGPNKVRAKKGLEGNSDFAQERIEAYSGLEPHICDVTKMGRIPLELFDHPDRELYDFIVGELAEKLEELRKLYYAKGFAR
jgi:hypothetical protein